MACSMHILILLWAIYMLGHIFYTATHFGFGIVSFFMGRKKGAISCLYRTNESEWALQV